MSDFELVPFGGRAPPGAAACDGLVDGAEIDLSHWPKNATPAELKADTSTEIALRFVRAGGALPRFVVNNHFDADGVLAVFALMRPEIARDHEQILVAAAETGDFDVWPADERGLWLSLSIEALAKGRSEHEAYGAVLERLRSVLPELARHEDLWGPAFARLRSSLEQAQRGAVSVERVGPIVVAVHRPEQAELPGPVLDRSAPPGGLRWLVAFDHGGGSYTYRYELPRYAWADTVVRPRLTAPKKNALAASLGAGWALKGDLGMTGLIRTTAPIRQGPHEIAARLLEREHALGTLPVEPAP
jgi:hypothetical protein